MGLAGAELQRMRAAAPLVINLTNTVATPLVAQVLIATGARPAMAVDGDDAAELARIGSALAVNIGTPTAEAVDAMAIAAMAARAAGRRWALDPVAVGATAFRRAAAMRLLSLRPDILRGNASEILVLAGLAGAARGVDAGDGVADAIAAAEALAREHGAVVAVTGPVDFVTDGTRRSLVANGHPLMARVSGLGCALTALCSAFAADAEDIHGACVAALACYGVAGEMAARAAPLPGGFAVAFLDALAALDAGTLDGAARIA